MIVDVFDRLISLNIKIGSKLVLTDTIPIKDGYLQLTPDNTRFQFGSNTFPRPRASHRVRRIVTDRFHR
jgi:hypothetical protein